MKKILTSVSVILNKKHKRNFVILLLFVFIGMLFEIIGIGILIPILDVLLNSNNSNFLISYLKNNFGIQNQISLLQYVLFLFLIIILIKSIFLIVLSYFKFRFIATVTNHTTNELFKGYLYSPYKYHVNTNSSILIRNIQIEMTEFNSTLQSFMTVITEFTVAVGLVFFLLYTEPFGAIFTGTLLLFATITFQLLIKRKLSKWGQMRQELDGEINKTLIQSFSGIKDIKLLMVENHFYNKFYKYVNKKIDLQSRYVTIKHIPRLYLEFTVMTGLLIFIYVLVFKGIEPQTIITTLTLFVGVSFKLIPSFNNIMASLQQIRFSESSIYLIEADLRNIRNANLVNKDFNKNISFNKSIVFENTTFSHTSSSRTVIKDLFLEINKNTIIGFIGESGSGKSTIADLMMGLLPTDLGKILVDGMDIYSNIGSWQKNIGYVPQTIYLLDDSILKNIAFGISDENICHKSVKNAIHLAQLEEFVNDLEHGVNTNIGEGGAKLSGGQRQRIGIARALYNNPELLIFDEATSALDNKTESAVMEAIYSIKNKTIIIIAHRLSTLSKCDIVYSIEGGKAIKRQISKI
jgi:ABC-type bacteriocin/lantibiotic exporter with double-glycine peptidase domain